jgi:Stealth protein CR2, conserved region 2/Stealth protein CR3, conserved region 3/Stealth protein CR1, conserved region 1/Stealth protein CR4, conserved region 4
MFRRVADAVPDTLRISLVRHLPGGLGRWLRSRYYRPSLAQRLGVRWTSYRLSRRHSQLLARPGVSIRSLGRRSWICSDVGRLSVEEARQRNLDTVCDVLEHLGADYFVVNTGSRLRHTVGLSAAHRDDFLGALKERLRLEPVYVSFSQRGRGRYVLAQDLHLTAETSWPSVRVSRFFVTGGGQFVLGAVHGCDVQFWDEDAAGTLRTARSNRVSSVVPSQDRAPARIVIREKEYPTIAPFAQPTILDVTFPIDAVYTWVDGSDPAWRAKKDRYLQAAGLPRTTDHASSARFTSRDELRYSLRSLNMYADWIRNIYLVTDDQVPDWLDTSQDRLRVISHRELFGDAGTLPTFNSHAIESRLHHIEGLAEHYLYLNDDVFFGRPVAPELFFCSNGLSRFFLSKAQLPLGAPSWSETSVTSAAKNNRRIIAEVCGSNITQKFKHTAHPQQRSVLSELEARYPQEFASTASHRFRSHDDISVASSLHHYYAYARGRAVPGELTYTYNDNADPVAPLRLQKLLWTRDSDLICLNDTDLSNVDASDTEHLLLQFLVNYFPVPSEFERAPDAARIPLNSEDFERAAPEAVPEAAPKIVAAADGERGHP